MQTLLLFAIRITSNHGGEIVAIIFLNIKITELTIVKVDRKQSCTINSALSHLTIKLNGKSQTSREAETESQQIFCPVVDGSCNTGTRQKMAG